MPTAPSLRTLIDTEAAALFFHADNNIVHHEFRRFVYGAELRDVLEKGLNLLKEHGSKKWLSDDRRNGPLKAADEEWCKTRWFPRVHAAGWKHWAVVLPDRVLGQMNMRRWIETYAALGINAHPFQEPRAALDWLIAQGE